jgi:hypothetical protein
LRFEGRFKNGTETRNNRREILPVPDVPSKGKTSVDARKAEFPAIEPLRPPKGAPNVVVVLIDDMGFGTPSVTGGPCNMPAM